MELSVTKTNGEYTFHFIYQGDYDKRSITEFCEEHLFIDDVEQVKSMLDKSSTDDINDFFKDAMSLTTIIIPHLIELKEGTVSQDTIDTIKELSKETEDKHIHLPLVKFLGTRMLPNI